MPLRGGMDWSRMAMSGFSLSAASSASAPLEQRATTASRNGASSIMMPCRTMGWSSATRTRFMRGLRRCRCWTCCSGWAG